MFYGAQTPIFTESEFKHLKNIQFDSCKSQDLAHPEFFKLMIKNEWVEIVTKYFYLYSEYTL